MSKRGPIIIAEDDIDDRDVLRDVLKSLEVRNEIRFYDNGQQVLDYLRTTRENPFLIISDVNLPLMSGTRLREEIISDE
jgi:CheY-like chemotaxis protein